MSKQATGAANAPVRIEAFSFGDDVSVIDGQRAWGYFEGVWRNTQWYEPPVPFVGLAKSYRMSPHHQSSINLKMNLLKKHFVPSRWMSAKVHERAVLDLLHGAGLFAAACHEKRQHRRQ